MPFDPRDYPANWVELRTAATLAADGRCQGCGCSHRQDGTTSTVLTVHHPDRDTSNPAPRLTVLCAACHLAVERVARKRR